MLILASDNGQKVWKWAPAAVYGNAGHTGAGANFNAPGVVDGIWWGCESADALMDQLAHSGGTAYGDEANGAYMVFSEDGVVTSYKPTGEATLYTCEDQGTVTPDLHERTRQVRTFLPCPLLLLLEF